MLIIKSVSELTEYVEKGKRTGVKSGLVPTMGALHEGHLSLVRRSKADNDLTIVSLFVNPIQFNNPDDLQSYPRQEEEDYKLLAREGVDVVFAPTEKDIYPEGIEGAREKVYDLGAASEVMEGKYRPGHFQGVANVVSRLFRLCRPTRAYFGMKDFQQIVVIRNMIQSEGIDVEIVACPIKRGDDGLALSSRNQLLTESQRKAAPEIYSTLLESVDYSATHTVAETQKFVVDNLNNVPGFKVEYFEIVDGETLLPVETWEESEYVVGCITVYVGKIRLIDNIFYRGKNY